MSTTIIIATHKKFRMPDDPVYLPLHVGAEGKTDETGAPLDLGYCKDNTGDNISDQNPQFCELTGLYWAWKNLDADHIGLVHYRRYFKGKGSGNDPFDNILTGAEIEALISQYRVIIPKKRHYYIETLYSHYEHAHHIEELDTAEAILREKYPEYGPTYDQVIKNRTWGYMFNMMIMDRALVDEYCTWLFDILFELAERLTGDGLTSFENRFPGRVSERLFNVWLEYQLSTGHIRADEVHEVPFIYMEKINKLKKGVSFLEAKFMRKKPQKSF
ncbi:MAG: DUF4422 domain-containing protein [Lachnospiraceae bacterium]|nr:DUF4422 domain-containing protein [Lachnospiraceae bacterium]